MMESPFATTSTSALYLEPILDTMTKTYIKIVTLDNYPAGPLRELVKRINTPELSIFEERTNTNNCKYMLCRFPNKQCYMFEEDIPSIFSYLQSNGYKIENHLTKIYEKTSNKNILCVFTYCP